jgi:integrase/recombinase XerD
MPAKLTTTLSKIPQVPNKTNSAIIEEFHTYMKAKGSSEQHQNNNLKVVIAYANFLGPDTTFFHVQQKSQITAFLDKKIKPPEEDPEKKWITTYNHYLQRIKLFFRWLYNQRGKDVINEESGAMADWETPSFTMIREKRTKRLSPYSENEIWDRDELLCIVKYEPRARNKAALTLFWDLDARNHEVTMLQIKNVRLRERWAEGEIPYNTKTGGGPILLTCSFPCVRDWLNLHPLKDDPEARLICNLYDGKAVGPEAMWGMMKRLKERIEHMIKQGSVTDPQEREKLQRLLLTKKWNPYCIRHSAITFDSDFLPDYALKRKVRWSMNSKQASRYIKRRMGDAVKKQILMRDGILLEEKAIQKKPVVLGCPRCELVNPVDSKLCSGCSYPLTAQAYEEIKASDTGRVRALEKKQEETYALLQTIVGIMADADDETKKRIAKQLIEKGWYKPVTELHSS